MCRSQWPHGPRWRSAAVRLLRLWVQIPLGAWIFVCCACCVLSGRGLCDELITHPEETYRLWCVVVCDLETSWMRRPWPTRGCCAKKKKSYVIICGIGEGKKNFISYWQAVCIVMLETCWPKHKYWTTFISHSHIL